jgi:hypothetical protein
VETREAERDTVSSGAWQAPQTAPGLSLNSVPALLPPFPAPLPSSSHTATPANCYCPKHDPSKARSPRPSEKKQKLLLLAVLAFESRVSCFPDKLATT